MIIKQDTNYRLPERDIDPFSKHLHHHGYDLNKRGLIYLIWDAKGDDGRSGTLSADGSLTVVASKRLEKVVDSFIKEYPASNSSPADAGSSSE
jgi:hypothetical protein